MTKEEFGNLPFITILLCHVTRTEYFQAPLDIEMFFKRCSVSIYNNFGQHFNHMFN